VADEVNVTGPGPNGERMEVSLKERAIKFNTSNLAFILVIVGAFAGGLLAAKILFLGQTRGHELLAGITAQLNSNNAKVVETLQAQQNHEDEGRRAQTELVHGQTEAIRALLEKLTTSIEAWFADMGRRQEIMNHNALNPERALPLRGPVPQEESLPARSR
jgi:hypothetical protein